MIKKGFRDFYTGVTLCLFSLAMYFYIIPHYIKSYAVYGLPPSFFPKVVTAALGIFSFLMVINGLKQGGKENLTFSEIKEHFKAIEIKPLKNVLFIFGLSVLYWIGLSTIGFLISTPIIIFLLGWAFEWRKYVILTLLSLITTGVLYYIFGTVLGSPLP